MSHFTATNKPWAERKASPNMEQADPTVVGRGIQERAVDISYMSGVG